MWWWGGWELHPFSWDLGYTDTAVCVPFNALLSFEAIRNSATRVPAAENK